MSYATRGDEYWSRSADAVNPRSSSQSYLAMQVIAICGSGSILDLGCGTGGLVHELALRGATALGLDASCRAVALAARRSPGRCVVADMRSTPFADASFDAVIGVHSLEWLDERHVADAIAEMFRVSRRLACLWIAPDAGGADPRHATVRPRLWWEQQLFAQGFVRTASTRIAPIHGVHGVADSFAIIVERSGIVRARTLAVTACAGEKSVRDLVAERDATIRELQVENRRLAELVSAKDASFATLANEMRRLESTLSAVRSSKWAVLGDTLRRPLGLRMAADAGRLVARMARNRLLRPPVHAPDSLPSPPAEPSTRAIEPPPKPHAPYTVRTPEAGPGRRPHVVHVIANFMTGGSSRLVIDLVERLGDRYRHSVVTSFVPDPPAYLGLPVTVLSQERAERGFARCLSDADLIHVHYWGEGDEPWYRKAFAAAAELACPIIENVNTPVAPFRSPRVSRYVFVSDYVQHEFGGDANPEEVIYPGSDLSFFAAGNRDADDGNTIGMVYRLERDKLDDNAIDPFILAVQRRPRTRAVIVGGGSLLPEFRRRVAAAGLDARFEFTNYVAYVDLPALYAGMTVFVAPVWKESFGQVSIFAMSAGVPVVGYAIGAIPEIVADPDLVAPFPDSGALADIIVRLLDDPAARARTGARNRERAGALYSVEAMVDRYARLYASLVGSPA